MGKRTGRPRGAPKGNTNRLIHGRYSGARLTRRRTMRKRVAMAKAAIAEAFAMVARDTEEMVGGAARNLAKIDSRGVADLFPGPNSSP